MRPQYSRQCTCQGLHSYNTEITQQVCSQSLWFGWESFYLPATCCKTTRQQLFWNSGFEILPLLFLCSGRAVDAYHRLVLNNQPSATAFGIYPVFFFHTLNVLVACKADTPKLRRRCGSKTAMKPNLEDARISILNLRLFVSIFSPSAFAFDAQLARSFPSACVWSSCFKRF